jgi:hypothetical protein
MLRRPSVLDRTLQQWQHRWETNPQFRAAWSGVAGLVIVLSLCACLGTVSTLVSRTVAGFTGASGSSQTSSGTPDTSTGQIGAAQSFPTFTSPPLPPPSIPAAGKIPNSQTPFPSPTAQPTPTDGPTATPCAPDCGGGGGGGGGGVVTGFPTPTVWTGGTSVHFTVHTSLHNGQPAPNVGLALIITFPGGGTFLDENGEQTDGSGNYTSSINVPNGIKSGKADVYIQANFSGTVVSQHIKVDCLP